MSNSKSTTPNLKDRFLAEVRRDPKRASILGVLTAVLLVMGVRMMTKYAGSPSSAAAASARKSMTDGLSLRRPSAGTDSTSNAALSSTNGEEFAFVTAPVTRDIFTPDKEYFPFQTKGRTPDKKAVSAKVLDPNAQARILRDQVQAQARVLSLQTTMVGTVSTAMINGQVCRIGQEIAGFRVVEISSKSCVLEKDGVRIRLQMAK